MAAATAKHFDILEYVKKAKESGVKEEFAEYQARQLEQQQEQIQAQQVEINALKSKDVATKKDLLEVKIDLIKWAIGVGILSITTLSGVMFTLLKLMAH